VLPFTFSLSEDVALLTFLLCTAVAWGISARHPAALRNALLAIVGIALLGWFVLLASGLVRTSEGPLAGLHGVVGHLMLPLVVAAAGLRLGEGLSGETRQPALTFARVFGLFVLCFCCFSNTRTGYFGPSWIAPVSDPDTNRRFNILHQIAIPTISGPLLVLWFTRLIRRALPSAPKQPSS
jgi:hypothetical protein